MGLNYPASATREIGATIYKEKEEDFEGICKKVGLTFTDRRPRDGGRGGQVCLAWYLWLNSATVTTTTGAAVSTAITTTTTTTTTHIHTLARTHAHTQRHTKDWAFPEARAGTECTVPLLSAWVIATRQSLRNLAWAHLSRFQWGSSCSLWTVLEITVIIKLF